MALKDDLLNLLRTDPEFRDLARRELLTADLLALPDQLAALTARVDGLAVQMERLAAAQLRTEARVEALAVQVEKLVLAQERSLERLDRLSDWRRDEEGRREGERYERNTVRHAYVIFGGGRSAAERPDDLDRLRNALGPVVSRPDLNEADDPFLADLLWLKGERIAVVEISRQVDHSDIERAERRAALLSSAGLPALAVVIGRDWASEEAERAVRGRPVEWRVGEDTSAGYLEFRRAPAA